jgi:plasmid maintenance system antidote protein VapI
MIDRIAHPGRLLRREIDARGLSANRLALDLGVPSGRITDILNGRRSITADTARSSASVKFDAISALARFSRRACLTR